MTIHPNVFSGWTPPGSNRCFVGAQFCLKILHPINQRFRLTNYTNWSCKILIGSCFFSNIWKTPPSRKKYTNPSHQIFPNVFVHVVFFDKDRGTQAIEHHIDLFFSQMFSQLLFETLTISGTRHLGSEYPRVGWPINLQQAKRNGSYNVDSFYCCFEDHVKKGVFVHTASTIYSLYHVRMSYHIFMHLAIDKKTYRSCLILFVHSKSGSHLRSLSGWCTRWGLCQHNLPTSKCGLQPVWSSLAPFRYQLPSSTSLPFATSVAKFSSTTQHLSFPRIWLPSLAGTAFSPAGGFYGHRGGLAHDTFDTRFFGVFFCSRSFIQETKHMPPKPKELNDVEWT